MTAPAEVIAVDRPASRSEALLWRHARRAAAVAAIATVLLWTRAIGEYGNNIIVIACLNVIVVAGLHVLVHGAGQVSLGQVAFVAIGAFATARANADFGLSLPLAALAGVACAVLASAVVGLPALRLSGLALAVVTLAFGFAAERWLYVQEWLVPVSTGLPLRDESFLGFSTHDARDFVIPVVLIASCVVALTVRLRTSALGRSIQAVAEDEEVAASYGISMGAHKLFAFLFAGACAGLAGSLTVMSIGRVGPTVFPPTESVVYVSAVLLGGRGPVWGSVVAGAALGAVPLLLGTGLGHYGAVIGPLGILFVVRSSDQGINGLVRHSVAAVRRRPHGRDSGERQEVK